MFIDAEKEGYNISLRGKNKKNIAKHVKRVHTPLGVFATKHEAMLAHGFKHQGSVHLKILSKKPEHSEWYHIEDKAK